MKKKDKNGKLQNIYIKKISSSGEFEVTYAKSGIIKNLNNTHVLVLYDGESISGKKDNLNTIGFSKSDFNLSMLEANTTTYKKIQENSSVDLFRCYENLILKKLRKIKKNLQM